nr:PAAR domain-containing protein [uncultured Capnocytophaga sp.]
MDKKQVVTINTMHTCPMTTGNTPHVGGPIIGPGCSTATLNGIPIALQGDKCICAAGGQDVILQGCPTATINGVPIALQGSPTAHGGTIPAGVPGAVIITKNTSVLEAGAEGEPAVYNLQWVKEEQIIRNSKIEKVVTLVADTRNIPNGEEVTVKVHTPEQDGGSSMLTELKGIVQDNQVQVEWKVEQNEEDENAPKIKKTYYTDLNGDIIEKGNIGQEVYLVIEGVNLTGKEVDLDLTDNEIDFEYKGEHLKNDILKGYVFQNNEIEHIKLKIIEQKNN